MIRALLASAVLSVCASAQLVWTHTHSFDTGMRTPNPMGSQPIINEPEHWASFDVPLPPPDATLVDIILDGYWYEVTMAVTNHSNTGATYRTSGLYTYFVGHQPGLYVGALGGAPMYLRGHGYDQMAAQAAFVVQGAAGGSPLFNFVPPNQTEITTHTVFQPGPSINRYIINDKWREANRRGRKSLHVTTEGDYDWAWSWPGEPGWGSHSPLAYSAYDKRVRMTGRVVYGHW